MALVDYFLKIDGIQGESQDSKHKNEIQLESWSWGEQQSGSFAALGGANSGTKQLIFGANAARIYHVNLKAADNTSLPAYSEDRLAKLKTEYETAAKEPSNLRYGYVRAS